ncbi:MAG: hypothetical protein AB1635_20965 [Acidobacteriota bacterium]
MTAESKSLIAVMMPHMVPPIGRWQRLDERHAVAGAAAHDGAPDPWLDDATRIASSRRRSNAEGRRSADRRGSWWTVLLVVVGPMIGLT